MILEIALASSLEIPFFIAASMRYSLPEANGSPVFVTGVGSGTTYPDYKPAPFIVSSEQAGVDMVTVVTEGIFSYCSFKVKVGRDPDADAARVELARELAGEDALLGADANGGC